LINTSNPRFEGERIKNMAHYYFDARRTPLTKDRRVPMTRKSAFGPLGKKLRLWSCVATFTLLSSMCVNAIAQDKVAVINAKGEVWARDLSSNSIGVGTKLTGPGLFGGTDDQFVVAFTNQIAVITKSGIVWPRTVDDQRIGSSSKLSGSLFGGPDAKYVFAGDDCGNAVYVVTNSGNVWTHLIDTTAAGPGTKLNGSTLFGAPNDRYVVHDGNNRRILVINAQGEVWAHDLSASTPPPPNTLCTAFDTIGVGYKLSGPGLFGAPNDLYVVSYGGRLLVINSLGEVWARDISHSSVGPGAKLNGPGLFGTPNDAKYVVGYRYAQPPK
jgi:hypothetical protein